MLIAIGIDVVETRRIANLLARHQERFTELVLSEREAALVKPGPALVPFVAGRWAAKEAIMKALGEGIGVLQMPEIEVLRASNGAAQVVLKSPDVNPDGVIDFGDYLEFLNRFDGGDLSVDFTADGIVDFLDYLEFLNLFDGDCS